MPRTEGKEKIDLWELWEPKWFAKPEPCLSVPIKLGDAPLDRAASSDCFRRCWAGPDSHSRRQHRSLRLAL